MPPELSELRLAIRQAVLDGDDWQERFGPGLGVGEALWPQWAAVLEPAGVTREAFDATVGSLRRELWFWVLGDRQWDQVAGALAGRLLRRLPLAP